MTSAATYSILITDDDSGSREALRDIMEPEGYRTLMASSGEEAIDIVRQERIHLALLDVHMPRLTGVETVQLVHEINEVLPCILVTADANENVMRQAFTVRAYSVIPKPVSQKRSSIYCCAGTDEGLWQPVSNGPGRYINQPQRCFFE